MTMDGNHKATLRTTRSRRTAGFNLIEVAIVVAIMGTLAALALPSVTGKTDDARLKTTVRALSNSFTFARSEAIRTGEIHLVFVGTDASGNTLTDAGGNNVLALVVNDGVEGSTNQNCARGTGEGSWPVGLNATAGGGVISGATQMTEDLGTGTLSTGSTFTEPDGDNASWVLFRPDGTARAFDAACTIGDLGSGAGGLYINNGQIQFGIALRPIGSTRVRLWQEDGSQWGS